MEISAAYGYLVHQFLSGNANQRTDGYADHVRFAVEVVEVVEAVAAAIGADRTALRVSPGNSLNDIAESAVPPRYHRLLAALDGLGLAYPHVVQTGAYAALEDLRPRWRGTLLATYDGPGPSPGGVERAERALRAGLADVYAFGRLYLANPDLPLRVAACAPLNRMRGTGMYGGGAEGCTDYPFLEARSEGDFDGRCEMPATV